MTHNAFRPLVLAAACMYALASLPLTAQTVPQALAVSRITEPLDESMRVTLEGNVHPLAQAQFDQGPAPASMPTGRIMLVLQRSPAQRQALARYLAGLHDPSSPSFHKWLTPAQYGATFGVTDSDLDSVEAWLTSHGFRIEKVPQARNVIQFSGTVDQVQSAFHTAIHEFFVNGETHYANISDPQIPAALAPVVAGIAPLNNFRPKPNAKQGPAGRYDLTNHTIQPELTESGPSLWMVPADAATIYDTPNAALNPNYSGTTYDGTGVNIGIAGDSNVTMQDILNYRVAFLGETATTANLPIVVVDGNDPLINSDEAEALLDTEIAGGIAPKATIYLYTSAGGDISSGLYNAIFRAIDDNTVSILNISFSACEAGLGSSGNELILEVAEQTAAQGISVTVSSGDSGSAACDSIGGFMVGLAVNGFASTPWNVAVGGTDFDILSTQFSTYVDTTSSGCAPYYLTAKSYIPEEPWNDSTSVNINIADNVATVDSSGNTNTLATGGGASSCVTQTSSGECTAGYAKPLFQTSLTLNDGVRDLPDIALFASNGFYGAVWAVCADNVADGDTSSTYTDCQTSNGQLVSGTHISGYGGTSTAAPAFAGMLALVAQAQGGARLGQADNVLYQLAQSKYATVFHDVTTGDNSVVCVSGTNNCGSNGFMTGYNASANYDLASGLGSVDAAAMVNNWSSASLSSTSTTLKINGSAAAITAVHGTPLTFNVGVTPSSASGVVGIIDTANEASGGPLLNGQFAIPLANGVGSASWNGLPGGTYSVSARYGGDASDAASTSSPVNVTITPENNATALRVTAYYMFNPLTQLCPCTSLRYGSVEVVADAQISGTSADEVKNGTQGVATGTVAFTSGSSTLGTAAVSSGNLASWPSYSSAFSFLPAGSYNITANYSGDAGFSPSTSSAIAVTVLQAGSGTSASASSSSISSTGSTTITVQVGAMSYGAYPTGSVTLTANGKTLATITSFTQGAAPCLVSSAACAIQGTATIQGSQLAYGPNTITATYSGDTNYLSSSGAVPVTLTGSPNIGFTLGNSGNITVNSGAATANTSTITVTPSGGFTGRVNLTCTMTTTPTNPFGGPVIPVTCSVPASVTISGTSAATATLTVTTTSNTTPGAYVVTVTGTDAATGKIVANTAVNVTWATGFTLTNSGNLTIYRGDVITNYASIAITPSGSFTGNVNLTCAVSTSISNPVSPPTCKIPSSTYVGSGEVIEVFLFVDTTSTTTGGAYVITVTGTDAATGKISSSTAVNVTVTATNSGYTLSSSGNITVNLGATATTTIIFTPFGGFTGQVTLTCSWATAIADPPNYPICNTPSSVTISGAGAATATLTVTTTSTTTVGAYVVNLVSINPATGIAVSTAVNVTVSAGPAPPGFTLSNSRNFTVSPGATTGNTSMITVTPSSGFTGQVNLTCAVSAGIFSPVDPPHPPACSLPSSVTISGTGAATATLAVATTSTTTPEAYVVTVTGTDAATGKITANTAVNVTVIAANFGFTLSNGGNITVNPGATTGNTSAITVTPSGGFTGQVNLTCKLTSTPASAASPATCSVPSSVTIIGTGAATATLAVATTSTTTAGAYVVTVTGTDAATGGIIANTAVSVTVNALYGFTLGNSGNITVNPGATTGNTSTITVTPSDGFTGQVNLNCIVSTSITFPVAPPTCSIPSTVTISGTGAATATLTVTTTAASSGALAFSLKPLFLGGGGIALAMVLFFGIPVRRRGWSIMLGLLVVILSIVGLGCGCGGGSSGGSPGGGGTSAGTYTATVTGTDVATGKITASTIVTITVN
jgi:hypothetical protein